MFAKRVIEHGNSLYIPLGKTLAKLLSLSKGSAIEISLDGDRVIVSPASKVNKQKK